jgi:serine/threonine-protein kinase
MGLERLNTSVGGYRLSQFLGEGGMGEVFRGVHERTQRTVAVKILSSVMGARELARFYHEARVLSALEHPNIVKLVELVTLEGRPCLVLEYVEGETLGDRIVRFGRLPVDEATRFLRDISRAVAHIHTHGIIHRDIKPHNIRVTPRGEVKLLDFGIAVSAHLKGVTSTGYVVGTPRYLSPEQRRNETITPASDVWALGVLYYEMITGRPPFDGETTAELLARMDSGKYLLVSKIVEDGSTPMVRGIDALVKDCLVQDSRRRLSSASTLAQRADALLGDSDRRARAAPETPRKPAAPITAGQVKSGVTDVLKSTASALERRWLWFAGAALAVVLAITAIVVWGPGERVRGPDDAVYHIAVQGTVGRAEVFVNGRSIGLTPASYQGKIGQTILVELRQDGYEPVREAVSLSANEATATFPMDRRRQPAP